MASMRARAAVALLAPMLAACSGGGEFAISIATGSTFARYPIAERKAAPPLEGESVRPGPRVTSAVIAGKVGVVNFWGTWCGPCRDEEPVLVALSKRWRARGVVFVGVNSRRDQRAAAIAFLDEFGVDFPQIFDPASQIAFRWRASVFPQTFVVDKQGRIAARVFGSATDQDALTSILEELTA